METLEQFKEKQAKELQKKIKELGILEELGPIPGLTPRFVHGELYGFRHIVFNLVSLPNFLIWAQGHALGIYAVENQYRGFYPEIPDTPDFNGAEKVASGKLVISFTTLDGKAELKVFYRKYRITFEIPGMYKLRPWAQSNGNGKVVGWTKSGNGQRQYLRLSEDRTWATQETLLTWEQFDAYHTPNPL